MTTTARFDLSAIEATLDTYFIGKAGKNEIWDEIESTNDRAIELAREGAVEGTMVLARQQTGGRGRQGRSWISPKDSGIFVSFILRPNLEQAVLPLISFAAGVACAEAIERVTSVRIGLKWVNDLVFNGKKLGGILAEMPGAQRNTVSQGEGWIQAHAVILGMGINLSVTDDLLPPELKGRVECVDHIAGKKTDANHLVSELCSTLEAQYQHLRHAGHELVLEEWKTYSHTLGKRIKTQSANEEIEGIATDLAESGALIVRMDNGETRELHAGEITIRLEDGSYS